MDPFTHTAKDYEKIQNFDFIKDNSTKKRDNDDKIRIDETFCTLITVGGQFLEKKAFEMVLKKVDEIRRIFRIKIPEIYNFNYPIHIFEQ